MLIGLYQTIMQIMSNNEDVPIIKPRRKKIEVPIHKSGRSDDNFQANSNIYRKKSKSRKNLDDNIDAIAEADKFSQKLSKRILSKENLRLSKENEEIVGKFAELEELSLKKITKLKGKISNLEINNEKIANENNLIRGQYENLLQDYENLQLQFDLSKNCRNCEELRLNLDQAREKNNSLIKIKKETEEDLNMLKTVVFRLNLQIERYQDKLRKSNILASPTNQIIPVIQPQSIENNPIRSDMHIDHPHTPISWGKVNTHTLGPLLDAYQDSINEKDDIIRNYEKEMSEFTGKLKEICSENEELYKKLSEDENCSVKLKMELDRLKVELEGIKEQNDVLIKKCAVKQDKVEEILKCYESKVEQLKRDYIVVHDQYCKSRSEIAALTEKNKSLTTTQEDFRSERQNYIPVSVHTASVNECKKWYEELKHQYEQEKAKLKENIDNQTKQIHDLNAKISELNSEKGDLESKVKHLEKLIKKGEGKFLELEHTLNEVQTSRSSCRKQLHKAMNFAKDLVYEQEALLKTLNQRQLENKAVKKIGFDIATRMDSLKSQLKNVQKDAWQELTTVEKRLEEQNDLIKTIKSEHREEIEKLQEIIKQKEENAILQGQSSLPTPHYLLFRDKYK